MKTHKKMIGNIKWKLILWIDEKYPEACWANLVMWQIGVATFRETFGPDSRWNDQSYCEEHGGAYCGKCEINGRLSH